MRLNISAGRRFRAVLAIVSTLAGCVGGQEIVADSLLVENPALPEAPVGQPPVPPALLLVTPTGLAPVATPVVEPDPILPKIDKTFTERKLPEWAVE